MWLEVQGATAPPPQSKVRPSENSFQRIRNPFYLQIHQRTYPVHRRLPNINHPTQPEQWPSSLSIPTFAPVFSMLKTTCFLLWHVIRLILNQTNSTMKINFLLVALVAFSTTLSAQDWSADVYKFGEQYPGYIITDTGVKIEGFIK